MPKFIAWMDMLPLSTWVCYLSTDVKKRAFADTLSGREHDLSTTIGFNIGGKIAMSKMVGSSRVTV